MDSKSPELKILVVDDSPVYRKLVEQTLTQEPCTVPLAKNGHQALDLFCRTPPRAGNYPLDYSTLAASSSAGGSGRTSTRSIPL
jgi:CheY-like chemotaxis protein